MRYHKGISVGEPGGCIGEQSRLKAGCSQEWLHHKTRII
jgi:hypothetical protein